MNNEELLTAASGALQNCDYCWEYIQQDSVHLARAQRALMHMVAAWEVIEAQDPVVSAERLPEILSLDDGCDEDDCTWPDCDGCSCECLKAEWGYCEADPEALI